MNTFLSFAFVLMLAVCAVLLFMRGRRRHLLWMAPLSLVTMFAAYATTPEADKARYAEERRREESAAILAKADADEAAVRRRTTEEAACRPNLQCWAERNAREAANACKPQIEASARVNYRWTAILSTFQGSRWRDQQAGVVAYEGDGIELQNGAGLWLQHAYFCDFNTQTKEVTRVYVRPGKV